MTKIWRCDKCGKEMKDLLEVHELVEGSMETIELCDKCRKELEKWLNKGEKEK